jgi:hypothetical protein
VHTQYVNGEVLQTAKLDGKSGVVATVAGKEVNRSIELERIINVVHKALEGNGEGEDTRRESDARSPEEQNKSDDPGASAGT